MYEQLAGIYDAIHSAETEDISFINSLGLSYGSPILDLCCGTGRITIPLAEVGLDVTGVDNAEAMLAIGREKLVSADLAQRVSFVSADVRSLQLSQTAFQLAVISQNSLMAFPEKSLPAIFKSVSNHLADGAHFFIDLSNPLLLSTVEDQAEYSFEREFDLSIDRSVRQFTRWHNDVLQRCVRVGWRFEIDSAETVSAEMNYYYVYPHLLQMLMREHHLHWQATYGDYDRSPFTEDSPRLLILAKKG